MLLVFWTIFSVPVISRIESIGGGQVRGGGWGGGGEWEAEGGLKQPFGLKQQCCALQHGTRTGQSTGWAKTAVRSSLVPHAALLMSPRTENCILVV